MVTLELDRVEARYGRKVIYTDATTPAISGGNLTALIGPNAAGKSTLFRRIAGQLAGSGQVRITGADRDDLRYMPQDTAMSAALSTGRRWYAVAIPEPNLHPGHQRLGQ